MEMLIRLEPRPGPVEYDESERWLVRTDDEGASEIIARDVHPDEGREIARLLSAAPSLVALVRASRDILPEVMHKEIGAVIDVAPAVASDRLRAKADRWFRFRSVLGTLVPGVDDGYI